MSASALERIADTLAATSEIVRQNAALTERVRELEAALAAVRAPGAGSQPVQLSLDFNGALAVAPSVVPSFKRRADRNITIMSNGRVRIDFSTFDEGKRRRHRETFDTRDEAEIALSRVRVDRYSGTFLPPKPSMKTFGEVADEWIETKASKRPNTLATWRDHLKNIRSCIERLPITTGAARPIEEMRDTLSKRHKPMRVNHFLQTASAVWKFAMRRRYAHVNPVALVERVSRRSEEVSDFGRDRAEDGAVSPDALYTPLEISRMLGAAAPGKARAFLMVAALTGMRRSEILGLRWSNVDLDAAKLEVRQSLIWVRLPGDGSHKPHFYRPKTKAGARTLPLPAELVAELRRWKIACPPGTLDLVFPNDRGEPSHPRTIVDSAYESAVKRARVAHRPFKMLRHGFASTLIAQGCQPPEVAYLMGHSSPAVTLLIYAKHWPRENTGAMQALADTVLSGRPASTRVHPTR